MDCGPIYLAKTLMVKRATMQVIRNSDFKDVQVKKKDDRLVVLDTTLLLLPRSKNCSIG
jgi:hypothetical protein